jgi:exodeoxyribonuclease V beta subunit
MGFDILSRSLNVFEPHFLEASAGTGKTFAIEHLVVRLLIEGDAPLLIEQVLVVTFTRAATRELRARIRNNLMRVRGDLSRGSSSVDYLLALCEQGEKAVQAAIDRIDAALICYDSAQIFTLHGFCHRLLTEFSIEAGVGFEASDPEESAHFGLLERMIKEHLKEGVSSPQYSPAQMHVLLKKYQSDPRKLVMALVKLASDPHEIAPVPTYAELLEIFLEGVRTLPSVDASLLSADLCFALSHYKGMTGEEIPAQIALLAEICSSRHCTVEQFDRLLVKDFFLEGMCEENKKVRVKSSGEFSWHYPGLIDQMRTLLLPPICSAKDPFKIILRLAKELQEKGRALLEQKEVFSPDALLLKVQQALKRPSFVTRVRQKFRAAIVDEFQDTDPIQWTIFRELFLSHTAAVCLVGDPKQSIYAFRNADVYVYLEAAQVMGEAARKHLTTNFRSTPALVEALNQLFSRTPGKWMDLPLSRGALDVIPVKAASEEELGGAAPPIEYFVAVDKKGRSRQFPTGELLETKIFPYIASEIFRLHVEEGVRYHDIVVLVKDRFQGRALIDYLARCGIQASSRRGRSLLETEAFASFKEVLAAACAPWDMSRLKIALGGPLIGWGEDLLSLSGENSLLLHAKATIERLHQLLFREGFGVFFQALMSTCWKKEGAPLVQELLSRGDESMYMDARRLCELLVEAEIHEGLQEGDFLTFLEELALNSPPDETRLNIFSLEERDSVAVMTMHMSKGLEFEVVFALGVASRHSPSDLMGIKVGDKKILSVLDLCHRDSLRALEELDAEKMRQFYVALTRAKRRLYIPLFVEEGNKKVACGEASPSELFFARIARCVEDYPSLYRSVEELSAEEVTHLLSSLSPLITYRILESAPLPHCKQAKASPVVLTPPSPLNLSYDPEPILSFSSLASHPDSGLFPFPQSPDPKDPLSPHTMPLGAETGHLLHALFEKIFKRGLHCSPHREDLKALIEKEISRSSLQAWEPVLLPWVMELLTKPLLGFSLSEIPPDQVQQEMEFFFATKGGMMKGFIDLSFAFGGKYYLLDWKSNYLGPSDAAYTQESMAEAMRHNEYNLQASIYAGALRRYVKLFDTRPFTECFGGAIYYFVRGKGVYHFMPESL